MSRKASPGRCRPKKRWEGWRAEVLSNHLPSSHLVAIMPFQGSVLFGEVLSRTSGPLR
jgi:hypothetical protein